MPPGPSIRLSIWLFVLACAGCKNDIALGSECPPFGGACLERKPRGGLDSIDPDAGTPGVGDADAGDASAAEPDGQVDLPPEGGVVLPTASMPPLTNLSLDITNGSKSGGLLSYLAVQAMPWLACSPPGWGPGAYAVADLRTDSVGGTPAATDTLAPTDGPSLVSLTPDGWTLAQNLMEPLVMGQRYAFMIDLASTHGTTDLSLEVQGGSGSCLPVEPVAVTAPAKPGVWTPVCVAFTATKAYRALIFSASSPMAMTGSRLFLDHIRSDPSCF